MSRIETQAEVIEKVESKYFPVPGKMPIPKDLFEIRFKDSEGKVITLEVDYITYHHLDEGDKGRLVYDQMELLAFADKVREL